MGLKLHLGCGRRNIPGFVHVDLCNMPHINFKTTIDKLPMFGDNSAKLIYCSHAFQYFDRSEGQRALEEWWRVLEPSGTLRLSVPDFDALLDVYRISGELQRVLGPLYGQMDIETPQGKRAVYHKTVFNFTHLRAVLQRTGFVNVRRYDWRRTIHKNHDDYSQAYYPHMDKAHGILISLNVEAEKTTIMR
jgi:predicted SAM-dependent methyltransferase